MQTGDPFNICRVTNLAFIAQGSLLRQHQEEEKPKGVWNGENKQTNWCSGFLEGWSVSLCEQGACAAHPTSHTPNPHPTPPLGESSAMQLLSWAAWLIYLTHLSLPPSLPSSPHKTHPGQRAGPQPYCGNPRSTEASRKTSSCKDSANELWLLQKSAFVFNGLYVTHQPWQCSALRSSYKSTKRRGQKKGRTAKDEKGSQEAFILKEKTETEGSGGHFLFEHSGAEGLERAETGTAAREVWVPGPAQRCRSRLLWCHPPRHKVSSAFAATVPVLWAAAAATKKKKSCCCFLMAAGSLNTVSGKDKGKVVRDTESNQDGDKLLWNVWTPTWTVYGYDALMKKPFCHNTFSFKKKFFLSL